MKTTPIWVSALAKIIPVLLSIAGAKLGAGQPLIEWLSFLLPAAVAGAVTAADEYRAASTDTRATAALNALYSFARTAAPATVAFAISKGWLDASSADGILAIVGAGGGAAYGVADELKTAVQAPSPAPDDLPNNHTDAGT
jgi:hypothetical protein